tara:strand:- start:6245 stop:8260 length:2016 start_codon:yes stop_codon:yes gene_type:complete
LRGNKAVTGITALVYDYDSAVLTAEDMLEHLGETGLEFIFHTTWSHCPEKARYRIVIFPERTLTPDEYPDAWENGLAIIGVPAGVDRQSRNISRHYILPCERPGTEYIGEYSTGREVTVSELTKKVSTANKPLSNTGLTLETKLQLLDHTWITMGELVARGEGKHKCTCPFEEGASMGSAFLRVLKDGRAFIQCTSDSHSHEGSQFWLAKKKKSKGFAARSVADREQKLGEVPEKLLKYAENNLAYNALQGIFYRYSDGSWCIDMPMRKESLADHLLGLMPKGCDRSHVIALIDHILSRQVYGFDCAATRNRIILDRGAKKLNLYAWPEMESEAGKWGRISDMLDVLCDHDAQAREWLLNWSAALVQYPERRSMTAVLVLSPQQGVGKSMYGRILSEMIGRRNCVVVSNRALRDSFNSHYVTSLLVLADEVGMERNASDVIAELKAAVTDDMVHCSTPYAARTTVTNRMSWWLTSNRRRPFLVEQGDRRFTVLSPALADEQYRQALRDCFDSESSSYSDSFYAEICAYRHALENTVVNWNLIASPYNSTAKKELQAASRSSIEAFTVELLESGPAVVLTDYPPSPTYIRVSDSMLSRAVPCETIYGAYREWCTRNGRSDFRSETLLRLQVRDMGNAKIKKARIGGRKIDVYVGLPVPKGENVVDLPSTVEG